MEISYYEKQKSNYNINSANIIIPDNGSIGK